MRVAIGTKNPVKIDAVKEAFQHYFETVEMISESVPSGVPDQPFDSDMIKGAHNRACAMIPLHDADFYVGVEGGTETRGDKGYMVAAVYIQSKEGQTSVGFTPSMQLPDSIFSRLKSGTELGTIMDELKKESNVKQKGGAAGYFTKDVMNRKQFAYHGALMALAPFINKELY